MRELLAKAFAVGLTGLLIGLAGAFAARQNLEARVETATGARAPAVSVPPPSTPPSAEALARGRAVFEDQGCTRCHRLEGEGNPRSPLDGVGARLEPDLIRAFIVAGAGAERSLSRSAARAKEPYRDLPADDLDALVAFLAASRDGGGG
jgi:mono/diheme cytochrome c family protein